MIYEAWRITFQNPEHAAYSAWKEVQTLYAAMDRYREALQKISDFRDDYMDRKSLNEVQNIADEALGVSKNSNVFVGIGTGGCTNPSPKLPLPEETQLESNPLPLEVNHDVSALRNLAPELLALWEAVAADTRDDDGNPCDCPRPVCRALRELNRKAEEVTK
jgi:hypothetical protein